MVPSVLRAVSRPCMKVTHGTEGKGTSERAALAPSIKLTGAAGT